MTRKPWNNRTIRRRCRDSVNHGTSVRPFCFFASNEAKWITDAQLLVDCY